MPSWVSDISKPYLIVLYTRNSPREGGTTRAAQQSYARALSSRSYVADYKVKETAVDVIGFKKPARSHNHSDDSQVVSLAEQLRLKLNISADLPLLRSNINRLQKTTHKKQLRCEAADYLVGTIASPDESRRMFEVC